MAWNAIIYESVACAVALRVKDDGWRSQRCAIFVIHRHETLKAEIGIGAGIGGSRTNGFT